MIEPKNDEERKAIRLLQARYTRVDQLSFTGDDERDAYMRVLAEARAIVREEQAAENPRSPARENELASVREEIRLRSEVLRAFHGVKVEPDDAFLVLENHSRLMWLLKRERELMGGDWVTNG